jgi:hypothetical protein
MKQTAVEWLKDQLECFGNKHELTISWTTVDELVEQAKEMEKEQITEAHTFGYVIGGGKGDLYNPEQYYNETFKSE